MNTQKLASIAKKSKHQVLIKAFGNQDSSPEPENKSNVV